MSRPWGKCLFGDAYEDLVGVEGYLANRVLGRLRVTTTDARHYLLPLEEAEKSPALEGREQHVRPNV
jgi:hypothetical protein